MSTPDPQLPGPYGLIFGIAAALALTCLALRYLID